MSFIKKEGEEESSFWDWVVLIAILSVGAGFWFYYSSQKNNTLHGFHDADSLFQVGNYKEAFEIYNELRNSDYLEPAHDSILTEKLDTLFQILDSKSR